MAMYCLYMYHHRSYQIVLYFTYQYFLFIYIIVLTLGVSLPV